MRLRRAEIITLFIVLSSLVLGLYLYPYLPERVASHWNAAGEIDGYMSKFWGAYLMTLVGLVLWLLLIIIPRLDPKKENIAKFRIYFDEFIILLFLFLFYLQILTLAWNLQVKLNLVQYLIPGLALLFFAAGLLLKKAEMNWTIGIKTPWTLSNEEVWKKTHVLGSKLFQVSAVISLLGIWWTDYAIWLVLAPLILTALISAGYSYWLYYQWEKTKTS